MLEVVRLVAAAPALVAVLRAEERVALALKRAALWIRFSGVAGRGGAGWGER